EVQLLEAGGAQILRHRLLFEPRVAAQPPAVLQQVVEQHRVAFRDRVVPIQRYSIGWSGRMLAKWSACPSSCRKVCQAVWPPCGRRTRYTSSGTRTGAQKARERLPS